MTDHQHATAGRGPADGPPPPTAGPGPEPDSGAPVAGPGLRGLRREREHKMLGGVCSGLGRHCDMDPVIFRIVLAVLSVTGGLGLVFYGFVWLLAPFEGEEENDARKLLTGRIDGAVLTAVLCALVGCGLFLSMLNNGGVLSFGAMVAVLLAGAGYWSRHRGGTDPDLLTAQAAADAPPEAKAPPVPGESPSWWRDPMLKESDRAPGGGYLWGPQMMRDAMAAVNIAQGRRGDERDEESISGARRPSPGGPRWIGGWVFLLALLAAGLGTGLTWDSSPLGTSLEAGLACALAVFGLGVALSAFLGRTGVGTIVLAVVTAGLLAGAAVLPKNITTDWTRQDWKPPSASQVQPRYSLGSGVGTLDLRRVDVAPGKTLTTSAEVGAGRLRVLIPAGATVRLSVRVGLGDIQLPGEGDQDVDIAPHKREQVTLRPDGEQRGGTVVLRLQVGAGQAEVDRAAS